MLETQIPERFSSLHTSLLVSHAERTIIRRVPSNELTEDEVAYLIGTASRFSLMPEARSADEARYCHYAYEVAVRVTEIPSIGERFAPISDLILSRLGNFPARKLLREKAKNIGTAADPFLEIESLVRELENRRGSSPSTPPLTDFQVKLLGALARKRYVSVSAPTSAGKSFTLELDLLRRLKERQNFTAIFIVPTRALIRQVSLDLVELMHANQLDVSVISAPSAASAAEDNSPKLTIFVLTQERLATLLQSATKSFTVDALIVDEAQEIAKRERGQTLERALRQAMDRYPGATIFFSSPLRSNPGYLISLFGRNGGSSEHFVEYTAPVTQDIISLRPAAGTPKKVLVSVEIGGKERELATLDIPFKFRGNCLGHVAHFFTAPNETSIVFCNQPSSADKQAMQLFEDIATDIGDPDLDDFAHFLETEVHRLYRLPSFIRRGIAFHYSNIPQIVRSRIEELLRSKKLKFVCCTSTLLQGVNLPAKNIFVENPKAGLGKAMDPGDYWNLVGRAGRLNQEFTGNVFKVFTKKWDQDPTAGDRLVPIESAFEAAVQKNTKAIAFTCNEMPISSESEGRWGEQALASIYAEYISGPKPMVERVTEIENRAAAAQVDEFCAQFRRRQSLPDEHFQRNFYVHPQRLENLADFFRSQPPIQRWLPFVPQRRESYDRLVEIFKVINDFFIQEESQRHVYFALLATLWMRGEPLRELVRERLQRAKATEDVAKANNEIRDLFTVIEDRIRYIYVKYTAIYNMVLSGVLREQGFDALADGLIPLNLFLEFGASSRALINFMSIGLSRTSSILLQRAARLRDDLDLEGCRRYINSINLDYSQLPNICKAEIRKIRGH